MLGLFQKLLLTGVAFFSLAAPANNMAQYPAEAHSTRTSVTVNVVWLPNLDAINVLCSFGGTLPTPPSRILGCYVPATQTIYAREPSSFNDHLLLEVLGHEFWHALGAEHPDLQHPDK